MAEVFISKHGGKLGTGFSGREKMLAEAITPQHQASKGRSRSSWLSDLLSLRKVIILCAWCRKTFNPRKHGYRRVFVPDYTGKTDGYTVNGSCDWCKQETALVGGGTAFQPEELYAQTHMDPVDARRRSRAEAKRQTVSAALQIK